jgi:ubiquinone biosynthesis protein UbiJ
MPNPLEALLRPMADLLNRNIAASTPARKMAGRLNGRTVAIRVRDTALAMFFLFRDDRVALATEFDGEPDVIITGSLLTLARLASAAREDALAHGGIDLSGDARCAKAFQDLLGHARPDVEEELSHYVGDIAAHRLGEIARGLRDWSGKARATMHDNIREYLQEESRDLPSRYEVERFTNRVDSLRDDVERLAARLARLDRDT